MTTCSVAACDRKVLAKGLCGGHYKRLKYGIPLDTPLRRRIIGATCELDGCDRKHAAGGLCHAHFARKQRGVPLDTPLREVFETDDLLERLRRYAPEGAPDECWEWTRARNKNYGMISVGNGKLRGAHIIAWELANDAELPAGMLIRHTCDNPPCTNPGHLLLGTQADNTADMVSRGRNVPLKPGHKQRTPEDVVEIRRLAAEGVSHAQIAERVGCSRVSVSRIVNGRSFPNGPARRHNAVKLTDDQVRSIRRMYEEGGRSQDGIAREFGISQATVSGIIRRVNWSHIV